LTLKDIDGKLDGMVKDAREKGKGRGGAFVELLSILNPREFKWLVRG